MHNLPFLWSVDADVFCRPVIGDLSVERCQLRHFDKIAETLFLYNLIGNGELIVHRLLGKDGCPRIKGLDMLGFESLGTQVLEQQIQLREGVRYGRTRKESGSQVFSRPLLYCADGKEHIQGSLAPLTVAKPCHTVVASIEHQVLERMRLVHEKMVYTHGLEIYHVVLSVLYLELDFIQLRLQVHLPLDKPFLHRTGDATPLLTQYFQVFLYTVQLILKDFLLYLVRLRYHAELVVREDNAIPVVVLDVVENPLPLIGREIVLARIEQLGIRVSRLESLCYLLHVGFESEYHRLVRQAEPLHLISCGTHDKRLSCPHLMVADPSSIEFEHPHGIFLTIV